MTKIVQEFTLDTCRLCLQQKPLRDSHVFPDFVIQWLRKTGATPYLRGTQKPNQRLQGGVKKKLFCGECEGNFSRFEKQFAEKIFAPYTALFDQSLTLTGNLQVQYEEWLLRFVISIHWRTMLIIDDNAMKIPPWQGEILKHAEGSWRRFLIGEEIKKVPGDSHILLFQNLANGEGTLPDRIPPNSNLYALRALDGTPVGSSEILGYFSKIGPIGFYTSFRPSRLTDMINTKVRMRGTFNTQQTLGDVDLSEFVFITRPKEIAPRLALSVAQNQKVIEAMLVSSRT